MNSNPPVDSADPSVSRPDSAFTLRREQARIGTEWVAAGQVRLRRRVVTETRSVQVDVRREELVVETDAAVGAGGSIVGAVLDGPAVDAPTQAPAPLVIVLREEVSEIVTRVRPYEQVTITVHLTQTGHDVTTQTRTETAQLSVEPTS